MSFVKHLCTPSEASLARFSVFNLLELCNVHRLRMIMNRRERKILCFLLIRHPISTLMHVYLSITTAHPSLPIHQSEDE